MKMAITEAAKFLGVDISTLRRCVKYHNSLFFKIIWF